MLPVVNLCPLCIARATKHPWIDAEHAIVFAADVPVTDGHIVVLPKEHVASIHALPIAVQKGIWSLLSEVRDRLRTGLVPDAGFSIGFVDALSAAEPVEHTVIHVVPRRKGDQVTLPQCSEWIHDDGVLAAAQPPPSRL
jgi:diadenosine tetraphosphate (Ap4A) HIT family hydrolase